ncbi:SH3 domain protein [Pseudohyphozyma bogoriensis]|nr:SH3 domain protein [Pseudohyphozyma bogoriensis]
MAHNFGLVPHGFVKKSKGELVERVYVDALDADLIEKRATTSQSVTLTLYISAGKTYTLSGNAVAATAAAAATTTTAAVAKTTTTAAVSVSVTIMISGGATYSNGIRLGGSTTATSVATSGASNSTSSSSSHGGVIAGVIIAVVVVGLLIGGFFGWKRWKAKKEARGSGVAFGAGRGKQLEDDDEMFGNRESSGFGNSEKYNSGATSSAGGNYGSTAALGAGMAGMGAARNSQQPQQQWNSPSSYGGAQGAYGGGNGGQYGHDNNSYGAGINQAYPPTSSSSANLLNAQQQQQARSPFADPAQSQYQQPQQQQQQFYSSPAPAAPASKPLVPLPVPVAASAPAPAPVQQEEQPKEQSSPFMESPGQGAVHVVKNTFEPSQSDELIIYPGDRVQVLVSYDDGWALGINLDSGSPPNKGVFPFDCLGEVVATNPPRTPSPAPQLAPLRSDSPLGASFPQTQSGVVAPAPTSAANSRSNSPVKTREQGSTTPIPSSLQVGGGGNVKRTSSLIAAKDASLFVALGDMDGSSGSQQQHQA